MGEWKEVILRDVVSILGDGLHGTPQYDDNGEYYFINGNNLSDGKIVIKEGTKKANKEEYEKYKKDLNDQTIFVSINGTLGNVALYNNEKCILGKSACYFNVLKEVDKHFIKYVVTNKNFQEYILNFANGTTIKNVSLNTMREYPFLLPPLNEQLSIATILSSLDDRIDLLHRQNKTLEQLAETLFRQWFVEEADEEWEKQSLGNLIELDRGISYRGDLLGEKGTGMPMHNLGSIDINGSYKFEGIKYYTGEVKEKQKLNAGDLLIINTDITQDNRIIGWPIFVPSIFIESTFTHHLYVAKLKTSSVSKFYLYFLLRYRDYRDALASNANGTTVSMLSKEAIYNIEIKIPPKNKREQFEMIANKILDKQTINQNQIRTLTQLRDTLLPKLMSGEVRLGS